ncbi:MAG: RNA ligase family protein [Myxococcales bacterium]|nr:RNA ligase family protein [Myxococcales bacterium]MCB9644455.1 RNA ligase family protein [Myxococcales bacterium]
MEKRFKYPRTPHLPWSPGISSDDLKVSDISRLEDQEIIVTEKMDGENTTIYRDGLHARSLSSGHHPSRSWVKQLQQQIGYMLPEGWRICGENLFARHSILYDALPSYFLMFSIWDHDNCCLSWDETIEWAGMLGLSTPPVLYRGKWDEKFLRGLRVPTETSEGYVVRRAGSFTYEDFGRVVAKWVRSEHVQTDQHWMFAEVIPNGLAG